tara:strand:- start:380 stop:1075 length:696 start_codon:yes stop_codon:yes gene_type:complete
MNNLFPSLADLFIYDIAFLNIVITSLRVSFSAVLIAFLVSIPVGFLLSTKKFLGRDLTIIIINTLMALPPVVIGLILYILFSNQGIFSSFDLLYSLYIMIIAQTILITPILITLSRETIDRVRDDYNEFMISLNLSYFRKMKTLIWETRYILITHFLVGFGRALSEVGAIIIVGGNIAYLTRTMTTGIVLETSRGNLSIALKLGITLLLISLLINILLYYVKNFGESKLIK